MAFINIIIIYIFEFKQVGHHQLFFSDALTKNYTMQ